MKTFSDRPYIGLIRSQYLTGDRIGQPVAPEDRPRLDHLCVKCGAVALSALEWEVPVILIRQDASVGRGFTIKRAWYCKYHRKFARKP